MIFSHASAMAVLFCLGAPFWHMLFISRAARHSLLKTTALGCVVMLWTAYAYAAVVTRFDAEFLGPLSPARPMLYLTLASLTVYLFRNWILQGGVSQHLLIGLQLFRPVGMVFVLEYYRGTLPGVFAHPAGWGDLAVGICAAYVLWRFWGRTIPPFWVIFIAVIGLADFASAFFFGFTSSATPVQLFSLDAPNQVLQYPLGLIPLFLVPYAVMGHILSLTQLARDRRGSAQDALDKLGAVRA